MPGAVPITSTHALTNATLPYAIALADEGVAEAIRRNPGLRPGVNVAAGAVTHPAVAEAVGADCVSVEQALKIPADGPKTRLYGVKSAHRPEHVEAE
jgi:alanine dehydrogenase